MAKEEKREAPARRRGGAPAGQEDICPFLTEMLILAEALGEKGAGDINLGREERKKKNQSLGKKKERLVAGPGPSSSDSEGEKQGRSSAEKGKKVPSARGGEGAVGAK